jgi:hypothetical protein
VEDLDADRRIILKWILNEQDGAAWTRLILLRTDRWRAVMGAVKAFGFHKRQGSSCLEEEIIAPQEGLCPVVFVRSFVLSFIRSSYSTINCYVAQNHVWKN